MDRLCQSLPERKRRAFLRYMKKGKHIEVEEQEQESVDGEADGEEEEKEAPKSIPHSRDDLLKKFEELQLAANKNNDQDSDSDDFSDFDDDY